MVKVMECDELDKLWKFFFENFDIPILLWRDKDSALCLSIDLFDGFLINVRLLSWID